MKILKSISWAGCSLVGVLGIACLASAPASAAPTYGPSGVCPQTIGHVAVAGAGTGTATDCNLFITFNADGSITTTAGPQTTYENVEDALIGVINNSGHAITSFHLDGGANDIFGFDGDGIDVYANGGNLSPVAGNSDTTGYGGFDAFFTNIVGNTGNVNFANGGIASGSHDFFSLEEPASLTLRVVQTPEPLTLSVFGIGLLGAAALRRKSSKKA